MAADSFQSAFKELSLVATGFTVKTQIPLTKYPFAKGGLFNPPFEKGGRGDFSISGVKPLCFLSFSQRRTGWKPVPLGKNLPTPPPLPSLTQV